MDVRLQQGSTRFKFDPFCHPMLQIYLNYHESIRCLRQVVPVHRHLFPDISDSMLKAHLSDAKQNVIHHIRQTVDVQQYIVPFCLLWGHYTMAFTEMHRTERFGYTCVYPKHHCSLDLSDFAMKHIESPESTSEQHQQIVSNKRVKVKKVLVNMCQNTYNYLKKQQCTVTEKNIKAG